MLISSAANAHEGDSTSKSNDGVAIHQIFRRPLVTFNGSAASFSSSSHSFYGMPNTIPQLMEEAGIGFLLIQRDQSYGRETFLMTNRSSEPLASATLNGVLPLNDITGGTSSLNYFPLEGLSRIHITPTGAANYNDHASSDAIEVETEKMRAPLPYSRFHYTQELGNGYSNFEGLFSYNPSDPLNLTLAVYRRGAGRSVRGSDGNLFNPRVDHWWANPQVRYTTQSVDASLWMLYTTAFSGLNGGIVVRDSVTDIFDSRLAQVATPNTYDHRTRFDALGELSLSLLSEKEKTRLAGYATLGGRRLFSGDSLFAPNTTPLTKGRRFGAALIQPLGLDLGSFKTRAVFRGDVQILEKTTDGSSNDISETRLSGYASDSLFLGGDFGISLGGYFRATASKLVVENVNVPEQLFTNFGLDGAMRLSSSLELSAMLAYARDRASLSPTPTAIYEIQSFGGFITSGFGFSSSDSLAVRAGYLDRREPEGIVASVNDSGMVSQIVFSTAEQHTSSFTARLDLWFSSIRISASGNYAPKNTYKDIPVRWSAMLGAYYEKEIAEGNLRLSAGMRTRYFNRISPALRYDGVSDYYYFAGPELFGGVPVADARLTSPKFLLDVLLSCEVDRRAQISIKALNILSAPMYSVSLYPRSDFLFSIDVMWAFLD